jgi:alkanesulfonate monooxygenase SsuD/methylene tetrahydromethanopterin reductase-like flavin-dependent oxidoreductase (luciferase family)
MLDHMSGGRAIIGFGRGLSRMEYEGMRIDQARRASGSTKASRW